MDLLVEREKGTSGRPLPRCDLVDVDGDESDLRVNQDHTWLAVTIESYSSATG